MKKPIVTFFAFVSCFAISLAQTPGSLDPTFGGTGQILLSPIASESFDNCQSVDVQSDGKAVFCGVSGSWMDFEATMGRLNVDGSLDATFANNGTWVNVNAGGSDFMLDLKVLNDDKILICGATSITPANTQWTIWQFLPDGALDPTFGVGGVLSWDIEGGEDYAREIIIQPDGYLIVGGSMPTGMSTDRIVVAKIDFTGNFITGFGSNGGYTMMADNANNIWTAKSALVLPNSEIFIVGSSYSSADNMDHPLVAKLDVMGLPMVSFDSDAVWVDAAYGVYNKCIYQSNHVLACGSRDGNQSDLLVAAHLPDGNVDLAFGDNGYFLLDNDNIDILYDIDVLSSGLIVACGTSGPGGFPSSRDFCVIRIDQNGIIDPSFGASGIVITSFGNSFEDPNAMVITSDDKILCAGFARQTNNDFAFARYETGPMISVLGCIDMNACNYDPNANQDNGSCFYVGGICDDGNSLTINDVYNANCECTGIDVGIENVNSLSISLYPNPAYDWVIVPNPNGEKVELRNGLGQSMTLPVKNGDKYAIQHLAEGMYIWRVGKRKIQMVKL